MVIKKGKKITLKNLRPKRGDGRTEKVPTESFLNAENTTNERSVKYKYTTVADDRLKMTTEK